MCCAVPRCLRRGVMLRLREKGDIIIDLIGNNENQNELLQISKKEDSVYVLERGEGECLSLQRSSEI